MIVSVACAVAAPPSTSLSLDPPPPPTSFADEPRWSAELLISALADCSNQDVQMYGATVGVGYYVLDNLAFNLDVSGYGVDQETGNASAVGVTLGLRHHLLNIGRASLFVDVGFGYLAASDDLPPGGTSSNFIFDTGVGVAYPLARHTYLVGGVRYVHVSNAGREGDDRNPSINAVQGFVGVMFRF